MYQELILMFSIGTALGAGSSVLARQLARGIIAQEGRVSQGETAVQVVSDTLIVASFTILCVLSLAYAGAGYGNDEGGDGTIMHAIMASIFGASFGAAGWSDARTSIVPDTLIGAALASHFAITTAFILPHAAPQVLIAAALCGIGFFVICCLLFQNTSWRMTPSDAAFYLIILTLPHSPSAFVINAVAVVVAYWTLRMNPGIARAMVSKGEQEYLEKLLADVYGEDSSRRTDWTPIGPMALIVATVSMLSNLVLAL